MSLSEAELTALQNARKSILVTSIPTRNEKGVFGDTDPGLTVYKRLETQGYVFLTEEDPIAMEDGDDFMPTPSYEITEKGMELLKSINPNIT